MSGRVVKILVDKEVNAGYYTANWDAKGLPAGIYFAKFTVDDYRSTKKLILLK